MLRPEPPDAAELLEGAAENVPAHMCFPREQRRRPHSTNPLERHHKEIRRVHQRWSESFQAELARAQVTNLLKSRTRTGEAMRQLF